VGVEFLPAGRQAQTLLDKQKLRYLTFSMSSIVCSFKEVLMNQLLYVVIGLVAGAFGGLFGIGGATILIPAMVWFAGLTQHQAQGTALAALLPPVGILAVISYYRAGDVKISMAAFICLGFLVGGLIGANLAQGISEPLLKKLFGFYLLLIAVKIIFSK